MGGSEHCVLMLRILGTGCVFFFKQKTAYEMRISDWSSDVCSSDLATMGAAMGSNVRVGLEDSLWIGPGQLASSNAEQVKRIRVILEALNLQVATPDEARAVLHLKGADKVAF